MLRRIILVVLFVLWPVTSLGSAVFAASSPQPKAEAKGFSLPEGNPQDGRVVFLKLQCNHCHMVSGKASKGIALPVTTAPAPLLDPELARKDPGYLVTAIIAPSHDMAKGTALTKEGKLSPMGDYTRIMKVRELIDLVAFLRSLDETPPPAKARK